tara:strand:- start:28942 stop:29946 length:1005 start_codon:yes stop_codon:yes gene_type:complete
MSINTEPQLLRPRRLRKSKWIRQISSENILNVNDLVQPLFLIDDDSYDDNTNIEKMPGIKRFTESQIIEEISEISKLGIKAVAIFPKVNQKLKSKNAEEALNPNNLVCKTVSTLRKEFPSIGIICDVALDPYTISGHDGVTNQNNQIDNDKTIKILAQMALNLSKAGCQIVAPSDMMDGRIKLIRQTLEKNNFNEVIILSYAAKFCSNLYGPFRNALGSEINLGSSSKSSYQLSYTNRLEAIKEAELDINEGADIIMIKPSGYYLDIIRDIKNFSKLPLAAFQVSGEYSMIKLASDENLFDYKELVLESLNCIKRAGASIIFSYFAKEVASWLK